MHQVPPLYSTTVPVLCSSYFVFDIRRNKPVDGNRASYLSKGDKLIPDCGAEEEGRNQSLHVKMKGQRRGLINWNELGCVVWSLPGAIMWPFVLLVGTRRDRQPPLAAVVFVKLTDSRAAKMLQAMWLSKADRPQLLLLLLLSLLLLFSPLLLVAKLQAVRLKNVRSSEFGTWCTWKKKNTEKRLVCRCATLNFDAGFRTFKWTLSPVLCLL